MKTWTPLNVSEENNRWNKLALELFRELRVKAASGRNDWLGKFIRRLINRGVSP